jgi:hypothetical protein
MIIAKVETLIAAYYRYPSRYSVMALQRYALRMR